MNLKFDKFIKLYKDPHETREKYNVVYKLPINCGKCCIGQTKCLLRIRRDYMLNNSLEIV